MRAMSSGVVQLAEFLNRQLPLLLVLLGSLDRFAEGQAVDCSTILKASQTSLSSLQPCVASSAGVPVVLDGSRRFVSPAGAPRQVLDLAFLASPVLLLTPGASVEVLSAKLTGVRLATPTSVSMRLLLAVSVQPTASLLLSDVLLETDCATLTQYQQWYRDTHPENVTLTVDGDLLFGSWQQPGSTLTGCNITCWRPTPVALLPRDIGGASSIQVPVSTDLGLYNALSLASSYPSGDVTVVLTADVTLSNPLWAAQTINLLRNITIVGGNSTRGGGRKPLIDLQDLVGCIDIRDDVVISVKGVTFCNTGMVFGVAAVPVTGLGLVSPFLWFFDFKRTVSLTRPMTQLRIIDCDIISYPEDVDHMSLWAYFVTQSVGPMAVLAAQFRVGVFDIVLDNLTTPSVTFGSLEAYGMDFKNTTLVADSTANVTLTARRTGQPLYALLLPVNTTTIPVWAQGDLHSALAAAQRVSVCSSHSNTTVFIQMFSNMSLDATKWPSPGFNISCNITISGSPERAGGTWLNLNLLSKFVSLSSKAALTFRYLTLINMPSQQRTYDLGDLTKMTLPLWPVSRPPGSSSYLILQDCTVVLPYEEYRSVAAVMGAVDGSFSSRALNSSVWGFEVASSSIHRITLRYMLGLNMTAINTVLTETSGYVPYASLLGPNIYGTENVSPPPPLVGLLAPADSGGGSSDGGLATSAIIAIAVAVPLGTIGLAIIALLLFRRRQSVTIGTPQPTPLCPSVGTAAVAAAGLTGEKGAGLSCPVSGGNSPLSDQSGDTEVHADRSHQTQRTSVMKASECESDSAPVAPPLHVELHQLILDFAREIEDKHLTIHDALGSGGFATVYRGTWRGIDVAVKVIEFQDRAAGNERLQARAMTEAAIAANIQHANVVTTYSYDIRPSQPSDGSADTPSSSTLLGIGPSPEGGGGAAAGSVRRGSGSSDQSSNSQVARMWKLYLIQEFCEVGSLRVALENRMFQTADGLPNLPMILRMVMDVVRGLQHLHKKNIVHGDLTPGNILLKANLSRPGLYVAKLADFGLSVKMNPAQTSVDNNRTGTPFYASPEVRQHGNLTKASDLFALGVVLWEMWHGRPCYQRVRGVKQYIHATGYPTFPPHCPGAYADLAGRCMRRALEERPHLDEVHEIVRQLMGTAVGSMSSGSAAGSDVDTSGAPSYEWPFVAQMMQETNAAAAAGGAVSYLDPGVMGVTPGGYGPAATGGSSGSARSVAAAGAMAAAAAAASNQLMVPVRAGSSGSVQAASALAAGHWGPAAAAAAGGGQAAWAGGGGTWPREGLGRSRMHQEAEGAAMAAAGAQRTLPPSHQQPISPRQAQDRLLRCVQPDAAPAPQGSVMAEAEALLAAPSPPTPPLAPTPAPAALPQARKESARPQAHQEVPEGLSISLNLPTADHFVTASGSD